MTAAGAGVPAGGTPGRRLPGGDGAAGRATLALEDGTVCTGRAFGAEGEVEGEICFNTSMAGYQEVISDPSYAGQIVTFTYPHIGNYGIRPDEHEGPRLALSGVVVRDAIEDFSSAVPAISLHDCLREAGVVGLEGIDTRALTKRIRERGAMKAILSTREHDPERLAARARASRGLIGRDLVTQVSRRAPSGWLPPDAANGSDRLRVVAYDFGMKSGILRGLHAHGFEVNVVPSDFPAREALALGPDGVFLSNGPGDPEGVPAIVEEVRKLVGEVPIFGICLGIQLLALALGGKTFKLPYGHRGANQPVLHHGSRRVEITAQNHGFAVDPESFAAAGAPFRNLASGVEITHTNLNDGTVEGFRHRELPIFAVQYHPEASPGPHDARYLFAEFRRLIERSPREARPRAIPPDDRTRPAPTERTLAAGGAA
jgi:carbamoyl-phosphate synthase small subunit